MKTYAPKIGLDFAHGSGLSVQSFCSTFRARVTRCNNATSAASRRMTRSVRFSIFSPNESTVKRAQRHFSEAEAVIALHYGLLDGGRRVDLRTATASGNQLAHAGGKGTADRL